MTRKGHLYTSCTHKPRSNMHWCSCFCLPIVFEVNNSASVNDVKGHFEFVEKSSTQNGQ